MLDLRFLGEGSAFCPALGNTAACLQKDGTLYLLDCGATVFQALLDSGLLAAARRLCVFVTHRHADHVGSLATLISYGRHVSRQPIAIVHPDGALQELLRLMGITDEQYTLHRENPFDDGALRVSFLPVRHTRSLPAYGLLLEDADERVYYSGDAAEVPPAVWSDFLSGRVGRVYQDVSLNPGSGHGDYEAFLSACPTALRPRFCVMHLTESCRERARRDGFALPLRVG